MEIDDILLTVYASRGQEFAMLYFSTLHLIGMQNKNFSVGSKPVFVSKTKLPIILRPAKFGRVQKDSGVLSNIEVPLSLYSLQ